MPGCAPARRSSRPPTRPPTRSTTRTTRSIASRAPEPPRATAEGPAQTGRPSFVRPGRQPEVVLRGFRAERNRPQMPCGSPEPRTSGLDAWRRLRSPGAVRGDPAARLRRFVAPRTATRSSFGRGSSVGEAWASTCSAADAACARRPSARAATRLGRFALLVGRMRPPRPRRRRRWRASTRRAPRLLAPRGSAGVSRAASSSALRPSSASVAASASSKVYSRSSAGTPSSWLRSSNSSQPIASLAGCRPPASSRRRDACDHVLVRRVGDGGGAPPDLRRPPRRRPRRSRRLAGWLGLTRSLLRRLPPLAQPPRRRVVPDRPRRGASPGPPLRAASAAAATDGDASRKPNSGVTSLAGISGALMPASRVAARALLPADGGDLHDVHELIGHGDQVGRGVRLEADDLAADTLVLERPDGGGEVAVAGHDDGDVHPIGQAEQVDDQLDVEVRLHPAVAELANVLDDRLVAVLGQEVDELALVLVFRVEPGVGVGANEVAPLGGVLEEGDVIDVDVLASSRVVHVGDVNEHRHVLAHG